MASMSSNVENSNLDTWRVSDHPVLTVIWLYSAVEVEGGMGEKQYNKQFSSYCRHFAQQTSDHQPMKKIAYGIIFLLSLFRLRHPNKIKLLSKRYDQTRVKSKQSIVSCLVMMQAVVKRYRIFVPFCCALFFPDRKELSWQEKSYPARTQRRKKGNFEEDAIDLPP